MTEIRLVQPIGFSLDVFALGKHDLDFLANAIVTEGIHTLLEVGCGISSLLLSQLCHVTTLENDPKWADKVSAAKRDIHDLDVILWDGKGWPVKGRWDAVGFQKILQARDRRSAGIRAPAQGLFLKRVRYDLP